MRSEPRDPPDLVGAWQGRSTDSCPLRRAGLERPWVCKRQPTLVLEGPLALPHTGSRQNVDPTWGRT